MGKHRLSADTLPVPHPHTPIRAWLAGPGRPLLAGGLVAAGLLPLYLRTLAPGLSWANNSADGGDLITAAATLGVAHPTGYPTYLLLARLAQTVLGGPLAWRTHVLSALCAALAAGLVVVLVQQAYAGRRGFGLAGGALAGVAFGLSPLLWSQAVITEVYSLHGLLVALLLATLPLGPPAPASAWRHRLAGLLFGLALGNHVTTALLLPPWLVLAAWQGGQPRLAPALNRLAGLAVGLLVYAYLPLRALTGPAVNWGNASTLSGLWWVVSGAPYRDMAFGLPGGFVLDRLQGWAGLILNQFGWLGMLAAAFGLFFGLTRGPRVRVVTGWLLVIFSVFAIGYNTADSYAYLLPAFLALAVWLGLGAATALEQLPGPPATQRLARLLLIGLLGVTLALNALQQHPGVDASQDTAAENFGRAAMEQAPPNALIFTQADRDTFTLWYFHLALGQRPDAAVIVEPLLSQAWYRKNLADVYPTLTVPTAASPATWRQALTAANPRPVCDTAPDATAPEGLRCSAGP